MYNNVASRQQEGIKRLEVLANYELLRENEKYRGDKSTVAQNGDCDAMKLLPSLKM